MGLIKNKLGDIDDISDLMIKRAMKLRELGRAAETLGLEKLGEMLMEIGEDIVDGVKETEKTIGTLISELLSTARKPQEEEVDGEGEEVTEAEEVAEEPIPYAVGGNTFGA
jgi:hypothetical protein